MRKKGGGPHDRRRNLENRPYWILISLGFCTSVFVFGTWTVITPSLLSARIPAALIDSGSEKLREKAPYRLSVRWNFSPFSSFSCLRSPLMVSMPLSKVMCTSSFFTAGSCAFSRYSASVSLMSTVGDHSTAPSPSPAHRGQRPSRLGIL